MPREYPLIGDGNVPYKRWTMNAASALEGSTYDTTVDTSFTALGVNDTDPNKGGTPRYLNQVARTRLSFKAFVKVIDNNATNTLTLKVKLGSVTLATFAALDVDDNDVYIVEGDIWVDAIGASGTVTGHCKAVEIVGAPGAPEHLNFDASAIDLTAAADLALSATWDANHNDNDVTLQYFEANLWPAFGTADES